MRVDVERVRELRKELREINKLDIRDIEFYENGQKIVVPEATWWAWEFIGLNNTDFVEVEFWKEKEVDKWVEKAGKPEEPVNNS